VSQGRRSRPNEVPSAPTVLTGLHNHWVVAATVSLATFMEVLDSSIANVSLPHIAGNLGASLEESTWVLTTYLVANVIVLPISGWISNTIGRKPFFLMALSMFTFSSVACGMAPNLRWLVFFRVLQGLGGGGLAPVALSVLVDSFPIRQRGLAMSIYGITVVVAPILGPLVGGWITDNYTWRWVFFINLPVGIVAFSMTSLVLPTTAELSNRAEVWRKLRKIDFVGLALFAIGLGTLEIVYDRGDRLDWFQSKLIVWLSIVSATALVGAVIWELRHPCPIVNLRLYKDRNFVACSVVMFVVFATLYGTTVLLPLMLQTLMGYTATEAGWVLSPGGIATLVMMPAAGWMMARGFDARWLIIFSLLVISGALYWMTGLNLEAPMGYLIELRVVQTFALAFFFVPIQSAAYLYLPKTQINNATGMVSMVRNEGASLGVAILNTLLSRRAQFHQSRLADYINPFSHAANQALTEVTRLVQTAGAGPHPPYQKAAALVYGQLQRQAAAMAYLDAFLVFSLMALAIMPLVFLMRRSVTDGQTAAHP
jgi:DHA2 family multidrug resistance protein